MQDRVKALGINDLAHALGVNRVTIDRAIAGGAIVPSFRTASGRVRFDPAYVDELQRRAAEARAHGAKHVLQAITAPPAKPKPQISAARFAALTAWKRRVLMRKSVR
jgi:predicted DNA-binding transcriptional regulator AlpA